MKKMFCVLLSLAALLTVFTSCNNVAEYIDDILPWEPDASDDEIVFDSLDKINYYAGITILNQENSDTLSEGIRISSISLSAPVSSAETYDASMDSEHWYDDEEEDITPIIGSEDISEYIFHITTAIYFKITVEKGDFLADKIGTGEVEVVITDLTFKLNFFHYASTQAMITFKNGERFYSCLTEMEELEDGENIFWTHLYIKGFELFKDTTNGISQFNVDIDFENAKVNSMSWAPFYPNSSNGSVDSIQIVKGSEEISYQIYEFTISDLENGYFNNKNNKKEPETVVETERHDDTELWDTLPPDEIVYVSPLE
ncbi:MAG: hypothetical protein IJ011_09535 [Clostridia bacterium]|nr:hypothetical protein [Clostridia bacterium]